MLRLGFVVTALWIGCISGPNEAYAAEKQNADPDAVGEIKKSPLCHKKIIVSGRPHRISNVAGLSAIRMWLQMAEKHGEPYSMWHNAKATSVKCEKLPRSDFYACKAEGRPCRSTSTRASAVSD